MREAVIVSTARTGIGRAFRGSLNNIKSPTLMGHAIRHAVQRGGIEPGEVEDVVIGTALAAGTAGMNIGRLAALAAGLPQSVPLARACFKLASSASGLWCARLQGDRTRLAWPRKVVALQHT